MKKMIGFCFVGRGCNLELLEFKYAKPTYNIAKTHNSIKPFLVVVIV
jgi:hypothetical protein